MDAVELVAKELISIKRQMNELLEKQKQFKAALLPLIQERNSVEFEDGKVYYGESRGARTFKRPEVLQVIEDNFGAGMANFIDEACTNVGEPRQTVYVSTKQVKPAPSKKAA